jgi:putative flippase GtrA
VTFVRYVIIQLLAYGIDMGFFLSVLKSGLSGPIAANVIAKLAAGVFAFAVHRTFTFRVEDNSATKHQAIRYFLLLALNVPIASAVFAIILILIAEPAVIKLISDIASVAFSYGMDKYFVSTGQPVVAKFIADIVCVVLSYGLSKHFVFVGHQGQEKRNRNEVGV